MERRDIPFALLTVFFCVVIFVAGRWSAPTPVQTTTVIREVAAAPSVIIVPSAAQPAPTPAPIPLAVLPEVKPAPIAVQVPVRAPKSVAMPVQAPKAAPTAVPSIPVVLEETPELPQNPYAR